MCFCYPEPLRSTLGQPDAASNLTVGEWLEVWIKHKVGEVRPSTLRGYSQVIENHIKPLLGKEKLDKLQPRHIDQLHKAMQAKKLSHRMMEYAHVLIHGALDYAVRLEMLPRNVANVVRLPRKQGCFETKVWNVHEAQQFLAVLEAQNHLYYALFHTALATGMRRGELLALKWQDVDLDGTRIKVTSTLIEQKGGKVFSEPKTRASKRTVALSPELVAVLQAHQKQLAEQKTRMGGQWKEHGLVFPSKVGTPIDSGNLNLAFKKAAMAARVPVIRLHDLRHTHASLLALRGISAKVIADRLGHTSVGFTLQVYTHVYDEQRKQAAVSFQELLNKETESEN